MIRTQLVVIISILPWAACSSLNPNHYLSCVNVLIGINRLTNISMLASGTVSLAGLKECHLLQPWHLWWHRWTTTHTGWQLGWITQRTIKSSTRWATTSTPQWSCTDNHKQNMLFQLMNRCASTLNLLKWDFNIFYCHIWGWEFTSASFTLLYQTKIWQKHSMIRKKTCLSECTISVCSSLFVQYFVTLSASRLYSTRWQDGQGWRTEKIWKQVWPNWILSPESASWIQV
jgi:hypothetical protein